jgi:hypothetical protein
MRALSPYARFGLLLFPAREKVVTIEGGYSRYQVLEEAVIAQFDKLGLMDWEADLALKTFNFTGLPEGVPPLSRVGVFDSEAFCLSRYSNEDERRSMQIQIDNRMRELQPDFPNHYILVEMPEAERPWGSFDKDSIEDILTLQERLEMDPTLVRRYEEENQARPEIIEAMTALETERQVEEITVEA